jgi:hypothetical protein
MSLRISLLTRNKQPFSRLLPVEDLREHPGPGDCQQCIPHFGGLAGSYSSINFIQAAGFARST